MDSLTGLAAFIHTAEASSFAKASQALGLSPSAVGKSVSRLEQHLGVKLLHRSTRRLSLTAEGETLFEHGRRILDEIREAEALLAHAGGVPSGRLRVSLPTIGYRFLVPWLPAFEDAYPEIQLDLDFNDRLVDVIAEGVDAVIRSGVQPDSRLMARRLGAFRFMLCASPAYLARRGSPTRPHDLERHRCLRFRYPTTGKLEDWSFRDREPNPGRNTMVCNNMEALRAAAIAGLGIAQMPDFLADDALRDDRLREVLPGFLSDGGAFWLLWPSGRQPSPKVRVFVDFLAQRLFKPGERGRANAPLTLRGA